MTDTRKTRRRTMNTPETTGRLLTIRPGNPPHVEFL